MIKVYLNPTGTQATVIRIDSMKNSGEIPKKKRTSS